MLPLAGSMSIDWRKLAPHIPLDGDAGEYVENPSSAAIRIRDEIANGCTTILVAGPAGVGKSTELAQLECAFHSSREVILIRLDRLGNMRMMSGSEVLGHIAAAVAYIPPVDGRITADRVRSFIRSLGAKSGKRMLLAVDGLEKSSSSNASGLLATISEFSTEADLVVVIPWTRAYGPDADSVIATGEKLIAIRPAAVDSAAVREFFVRIVIRRLVPQLPPGAEFVDLANMSAGRRTLLDRAALLSGGIIRTYLQLLADAASRARATVGADWPSESDLTDAAADQTDSFRRLLLPGDAGAIRDANETDGRELALERKVRLLNHGILLETGANRTGILRMHPLVEPLL